MQAASEPITSGTDTTDANRASPPVMIDMLLQAWLDAQCSIVAGLSCGVVFRRNADQDTLIPVAQWPHGGSVPAVMAEVAMGATDKQCFVTQADDSDQTKKETCIVASSLSAEDGQHCVAVLELPASMRNQREALFQLLQWGATWYRLLKRERRGVQHRSPTADVVELLATSLGHQSFQASAITAVTDLCVGLSCTRVSLGLMRGSHIVVVAVSNSADVDTRSSLVRDTAAAMEEAIDQDAMVAWPTPKGAMPYICSAQKALAKRADVRSVCSLPLLGGEQVIGALTLEHNNEHGLDQEAVALCKSYGSLLGPIIELKRNQDSWIGLKILRSVRDLGRRLFGPRHLTLKVCVALSVLLGALMCIVSAEYRITAHARVEGSVKRVITSPQDGYVASALLQAGDSVVEGQLIATLDDRELKLERLKWLSRAEQLNKELRAAAVAHDRSETAIRRAQMKQISAQLALVDARLERTQLTAPLSGIVLSGDLSQRLGSPVKQGQVLFEVSPLESFRVILEVDERDIGEVVTNQAGNLTLTALPDVALPISVSRVVPLATSKDTQNIFEVEARIDSTSTAIRPGMEGIGKISVDERKLIWIWTHKLMDWFRLTFWSWAS